MKRHIRIIICAIAIIVIICAAFNANFIYGYFHDQETLQNEFPLGSVETVIIEENDTKPIVAGEDFKKIVRVKNIGGNACYVRVMVLISPEEYTDELNLDINTAQWEYQNGYYYYKQALKAGEVTAPLFTKVHIPDDLEQGDVFDINVYNESIQAAIYNGDGTIVENYVEIFEKL